MLIGPGRDLYAPYANLRARDPVHEDPRGVWLLTRHDDVSRALRDPRLGRTGLFERVRRWNGAASSAPAPPLNYLDPPAHTRLRNLVGKVLAQSVIENLRPRIQQRTDSLLAADLRTGEMELIADFAMPLSLRAIMDLLGAPESDYSQFLLWARDMMWSMEAAAPASGPLAQRAASMQTVTAYFRDFIGERRKRRRSDLVSLLVAVKDDEGALQDDEILDFCGFLFVAGHTTTVNLIGNGVLSLLRQPSELHKLRENPKIVAQAVEEFLRYESPVQRVGRIAYEDIEIRGKLIPKGAIVCAILGAANRDCAQFDEPDRLDVARRGSRHLAFGHGAHVCLGASLARLEGQIAIGALVSRLPNLTLTEDVPQWRDSPEMRGLKALRVAF